MCLHALIGHLWSRRQTQASPLVVLLYRLRFRGGWVFSPVSVATSVGSRGRWHCEKRELVSVRCELFEVREPTRCVRGKVPTQCVCLSLLVRVNCWRVRQWENRSSSLLCPWLWPHLCILMCSYSSSGLGTGLQLPEENERKRKSVHSLFRIYHCFVFLYHLLSPSEHRFGNN